MGISGVFSAVRKDGTRYFRASITYKERHISLGSFDNEKAAGAAYALAAMILFEREPSGEQLENLLNTAGNEELRRTLESVTGNKERSENKESTADIVEQQKELLSISEDAERTRFKRLLYDIENYDLFEKIIEFDKWVMLLNLKKTGMYIKNPIFLYDNYFVYYIERDYILKFDVDDLFFYRNHKIQKRGGHLFYSDYGMQTNLLNRYGIRSFAVKNRDYCFVNGDDTDFRYGNLLVINKYNGVRKQTLNGKTEYVVKIHANGDLTVGRYDDEITAAIAYNKAADRLEEAEKKKKIAMDDLNSKSAVTHNWTRNYIEEMKVQDYLKIYESIRFSNTLKRWL